MKCIHCNEDIINCTISCEFSGYFHRHNQSHYCDENKMDIVAEPDLNSTKEQQQT